MEFLPDLLKASPGLAAAVFIVWLCFKFITKMMDKHGETIRGIGQEQRERVASIVKDHGERMTEVIGDYARSADQCHAVQSQSTQAIKDNTEALTHMKVTLGGLTQAVNGMNERRRYDDPGRAPTGEYPPGAPGGG